MGSLVTEEVALSWARRHVAYRSAEEIQRRPWGRTLRLSADDGTFYLKHLSGERTTECLIGPALTDLFPDETPCVLAADASLGLLLSRDHGGQDLPRSPSTRDLSDLLTRYASLQARARWMPDLLASLPSVDPPALVGTVIDFLNSRETDPDGAVAARYWLTDSEATQFAAKMEAGADWMHGLLAASLELPRTINHGDLHFGNVAVRADGSFVLYDWNDAVAGPAGYSLPFAYGSIASLLEDLTLCAKSRAEHPLTDYVDALAGAGYATPDALWESLPGAALAGTLRALTDFGLYPDPDPASWADMRERVRLSLIGLCEASDAALSV